MSAPAPAPAWYQDPYDTARVRWWNGQSWTTAVRQHPSTTSPSPPPPPPAALPADPVPPPPSPPRADPAPPVDPVPPPAAPTAATSFGAALLPPLTPPRPAGDDEREPAVGSPVAPAPSKKLRLVLVAGIVVAFLALAVGAYSTGMIGASSREASTAGATVLEGPDFSLEAPAGWTETDATASTPDNVTVIGLRGAGGVELAVVRSEDRTEVPDDPEIRRRLVDLMIATQSSVITNAQVLSRVPTTLDGAEAELLSVQGTTPSGQSEQAYEVVALHGGRMYLVVLGGPPDAVADAKDDFDAIVASFRFEG